MIWNDKKYGIIIAALHLLKAHSPDIPEIYLPYLDYEIPDDDEIKQISTALQTKSYILNLDQLCKLDFTGVYFKARSHDYAVFIVLRKMNESHMFNYLGYHEDSRTTDVFSVEDIVEGLL